MSIRSEALRWFSLKYGTSENKIYTSKFYTPEESWPKTKVWWMKIPSHSLDSRLYDHINILCQVAPLSTDFHYLKVPVIFFWENIEAFHRIGGEIDLYLSANPNSLFLEERGKGKLDFSKFKIENSSKQRVSFLP